MARMNAPVQPRPPLLDAAEAEGEVVRERGREGGRREEGDIGLPEAEPPFARRVHGDPNGIVGALVAPVGLHHHPAQPDRTAAELVVRVEQVDHAPVPADEPVLDAPEVQRPHRDTLACGRDAQPAVLVIVWTVLGQPVTAA